MTHRFANGAAEVVKKDVKLIFDPATKELIEIVMPFMSKSEVMTLATTLLIIHSLVAVALLGAITHQTLATWAPARARSGSFFSRFRAVPPASRQLAMPLS